MESHEIPDITPNIHKFNGTQRSSLAYGKPCPK